MKKKLAQGKYWSLSDQAQGHGVTLKHSCEEPSIEIKRLSVMPKLNTDVKNLQLNS